MKRLAFTLALLAATGLAQAASHEHAGHDLSSHPVHAATYPATGVVKAVKPGKVQIAHDPIPALEWPQMTMWFEIGNMPDAIRPGDAVRFEIMQRGDRKWQVEKIEKR